MTHEEIISHLSHLIDKPAADKPKADILYSISMQQVIHQIAQRMGDDALSLSQEDLELAREEVMAVPCPAYFFVGCAWLYHAHHYNVWSAR